MTVDPVVVGLFAAVAVLAALIIMSEAARRATRNLNSEKNDDQHD